MNLNIRQILKVMGLVLVIIGVSMIPSLIISIIYAENIPRDVFAGIISITIILGIALVKSVKSSPKMLKNRDGFFIVTFIWFLISFIGCLPFFLTDSIPNFINAFFESCSGFSTTGASILGDIQSLPKSILFWRSFTHWIGGMGILVFAIALLPSLGLSGQSIVSAEAPGPTLEKITPKLSDTAKNLYVIYSLFTVSEVILLMLGGVNLYDALVHTFGTVGTGGFSTYNNSIGQFQNPYVIWVITIFMFASGINFNLYFIAIKRGMHAFIKDVEFKVYLGIFLTISILITANLLLSETYSSVGYTIRHSFFQTASIITTTGYATVDYETWPAFSMMLIFFLFFCGASSSSTGGGVKVIRLVVLFKMIKRDLQLKLHPNAFVPIKVGKKVIPSETASSIANHTLLYIALGFVASIIVALDGESIMTSISAVFSCLGNIGPGFDMVGPSHNYNDFSSPIKFILSILMICGRLELFTVVILITPRFWNTNR